MKSNQILMLVVAFLLGCMVMVCSGVVVEGLQHDPNNRYYSSKEEWCKHNPSDSECRSHPPIHHRNTGQ